MKFDIYKIKPLVDRESDKFSWNLFRFMRKNSKRDNLRVYYDNRDNDLDFNSILQPYKVFIGYKEDDDDDNMTGSKLSSIITSFGNSQLQMGYLMKCNGFNVDEWIDITEEFWDAYDKRGRCLFFIHGSWIQGFETQFTEHDNIRICTWCGVKEKKIVTETMVPKTIVTWEKVEGQYE